MKGSTERGERRRTNPRRVPCILVTCEHGGNRVPAPYRSLFHSCRRLLDSHRGWDPGALVMARELARALDAPLFHSQVTRLLVDLNRSPGHRALFSTVTAPCPAAARAQIVARYHRPYRDRVATAATNAIRAGRPVLHLSIHSFTPRLGTTIRRADVGLLYDPSHRAERRLCGRLRARLRQLDAGLVVRRNYPYRGNADGLTSTLRRRFPAASYLGIELEISQRHAARPPRAWAHLRRLLIRAIGDCLG